MDVLDAIGKDPRPLSVANWWRGQAQADVAVPLDDEEESYMEVFTSTEVDLELRIGRGVATFTNLTAEDSDRATKHFGTDVASFCNWENRRRIVAHYTITHPATIAYELGLYRFSRDSVPPLFIWERVYEFFTGEEAITDEKASRLAAAAELLVPVVAARVLRFVRVVPTTPEYTGSLTDPLWDLPPEGGGMRINGVWYTEHALERMAPRSMRQQIIVRCEARLRRLGLTPGSPAWDPCLRKAISDIDTRNVGPSIVENEIQRPGSTDFKVITAKRKQVVVTVIPRKRSRAP